MIERNAHIGEEDQRLTSAVQRMLLRITRALARIVLRQNIAYATFEKIAKRAFIEVAQAEYGLPGKPANKSRIALVTGINRRDVARSLADTGAAEQDPLFNPVFRLVSLWIRKPEYLDDQGQSLALKILGDAPSIESLQKLSSPDMPVTAVVRALVSSGLADYCDDGKTSLELCSRGYFPKHDVVGKFELLGIDATALLNTIEHNIHSAQPAMFQRKVSFSNLSDSGIEHLHQVAKEKAQTLLVETDAELASHLSVEGGRFAGMGIYVFVENDSNQIDQELSKQEQGSAEEE